MQQKCKIREMSDTIRRNEHAKKMLCTFCTICTIEGKVQKVQIVQCKNLHETVEIIETVVCFCLKSITGKLKLFASHLS